MIADELAVCRETLYNWKNQLLGKEAPALMRRKSQTESCLPDDRAELEKTIATLKHDIHQLQLEHDLLQKANELLKKAWAST